jgi:anti-sigma B factor antagonist
MTAAHSSSVSRIGPVDAEFTVGIDPVGRRVTAIGELDLATAARLTEAAGRLDPSDIITVDLAGVGFVDSSGLGALISVRQRCLAAGGDLRLTRPRRNVRRVIDLTGLTPLLA